MLLALHRHFQDSTAAAAATATDAPRTSAGAARQREAGAEAGPGAPQAAAAEGSADEDTGRSNRGDLVSEPADVVPKGFLSKLLSLSRNREGRQEKGEAEVGGAAQQGRGKTGDGEGGGLREHLEALAGTLSRLSAALGSLADCW